ncbi:MAG: hypothetical protein RhofKO_25800 [Rhodothermales bacterium]
MAKPSMMIDGQERTVHLTLEPMEGTYFCDLPRAEQEAELASKGIDTRRMWYVTNDSEGNVYYCQ